MTPISLCLTCLRHVPFRHQQLLVSSLRQKSPYPLYRARMMGDNWVIFPVQRLYLKFRLKVISLKFQSVSAGRKGPKNLSGASQNPWKGIWDKAQLQEKGHLVFKLSEVPEQPELRRIWHLIFALGATLRRIRKTGEAHVLNNRPHSDKRRTTVRANLRRAPAWQLSLAA